MCAGEDVRGVWRGIIVAVLNAKKRDVAEKAIVAFSDRQDFNLRSSFTLCVEIRDLNLNPIKYLKYECKLLYINFLITLRIQIQR